MVLTEMQITDGGFATDAALNAVHGERTVIFIETVIVTEMVGMPAIIDVEDIIVKTCTKQDIMTAVGQEDILVREKIDVSIIIAEVTETVGMQVTKNAEDILHITIIKEDTVMDAGQEGIVASKKTIIFLTTIELIDMVGMQVTVLAE
ncbi:hypothetical protein [Sulfurovum lithotrophicum]|nr:hypothetical protein [Sulfurovum lithotrophicum]